MKTLGILLALGATMGLAGCFTVDTAPLARGGEHVVMRNYGWKLFDWIPLVCGNANEDGATGFALFRDDVTAEKIQSRFARYVGSRTVETPVYDVNDTIFFNVFGVPIPYILTYKEITLSGTLK